MIYFCLANLFSGDKSHHMKKFMEGKYTVIQVLEKLEILHLSIGITEMKQGRSSTTAAVPVYFSLFTFLQYQRKEMELDTLIAQVNA